MKKTVLQKSEAWNKDLKLINKLIQDGFIHVTGLSAKARDNDPEIIQASGFEFERGEEGSLDYNNSMTAVITPEGFYFLKSGVSNITDEIADRVVKRSVGVYCSNGDTILSQALFERVSEPLCESHGDPFYGI